jgi:hypothetical protein
VLLRKAKVEEYYNMKQQWKSMTPGQEERFSDFRDRKSLIGERGFMVASIPLLCPTLLAMEVFGKYHSLRNRGSNFVKSFLYQSFLNVFLLISFYRQGCAED